MNDQEILAKINKGNDKLAPWWRRFLLADWKKKERIYRVFNKEKKK